MTRDAIPHRTTYAGATEIAAAIVGATVSGAVLLVLPGLVGALDQAYAFSQAQLGYLASSDLSGLAVGAALGALSGPRLGLSRCIRSGLIISAVANAACGGVQSFSAFLLLRLCAGLGAGMAMALCMTVLARSREVERNFGINLICQLLFAALVLKYLPAIAHVLGVATVFLLLALILLLAALITSYLKTSKCQSVSLAEQSGPREPTAWIAVAGCFLLFSSQGIIWPYLQIIGQRGGLTQEAAATSLAISSVAALLGPVLVTCLGARVGRAIPLSSGIGAYLFSLWLLTAHATEFRFALAACLFNASTNFCAPFASASIAAVDRSGTVVGWSASASLAGLAVGPLLSAAALHSGSGFSSVLALGAVVGLVSVVGFIPVWTRARRLPLTSQHWKSADG